MAHQSVITFRQYPLEIGQRIYIEDGPRRGDWEVVGLTDKAVKLRCPVSHREVEWKRFCYFTEESRDTPWPHSDNESS